MAPSNNICRSWIAQCLWTWTSHFPAAIFIVRSRKGAIFTTRCPKWLSTFYGYREILSISRSMQSWPQSRNTGLLQGIDSTPSYFNATGARAKFSERYSNTTITSIVISTSHIMSRYISTASAGPDTSSGQSTRSKTDLLTISMSSGRCHQRDQWPRNIPKPYPLECRSRSVERGNEVSSRGIYPYGNNELEVSEDKHLPPILKTKATSIFMMLLRAHSFTNVSQWETGFYRKRTSLTNFRHRILNPMIH